MKTSTLLGVFLLLIAGTLFSQSTPRLVLIESFTSTS